jgi:hypothetical protein
MKALTFLALGIVVCLAQPAVARPMALKAMPRVSSAEKRPLLYVATPGEGDFPPQILVYHSRSRFLNPFMSISTGLVELILQIAVDASNRVYAADDFYGIIEYRSGETQPALQIPLAGAAEGVAVDAHGVTYVSSRTGELFEFEPHQTKPFVTITGLSSPGILAVDGNGNLFVTESVSNSAGMIAEIAAGSQTPVPLALKGVTFPEGVAFDPAGDMFVTDGNIQEILAFHPRQTKPFEVIEAGGFVGPPVFGANGVMYAAEDDGLAMYRSGKKKPFKYVVSGLTQYGETAAAAFPPAVP